MGGREGRCADLPIPLPAKHVRVSELGLESVSLASLALHPPREVQATEVTSIKGTLADDHARQFTNTTLTEWVLETLASSPCRDKSIATKGRGKIAAGS